MALALQAGSRDTAVIVDVVDAAAVTVPGAVMFQRRPQAMEDVTLAG